LASVLFYGTLGMQHCNVSSRQHLLSMHWISGHQTAMTSDQWPMTSIQST